MALLLFALFVVVAFINYVMFLIFGKRLNARLMTAVAIVSSLAAVYCVSKLIGRLAFHSFDLFADPLTLVGIVAMVIVSSTIIQRLNQK